MRHLVQVMTVQLCWGRAGAVGWGEVGCNPQITSCLQQPQLHFTHQIQTLLSSHTATWQPGQCLCSMQQFVQLKLLPTCAGPLTQPGEPSCMQPCQVARSNPNRA
jgi:hypothetical protein